MFDEGYEAVADDAWLMASAHRRSSMSWAQEQDLTRLKDWWISVQAAPPPDHQAAIANGLSQRA
jgi:hypothetical protein